MAGKGIYYYENGDVYDGEWVDGSQHGQGSLRYAAGGASYEGHWDSGEKSGHGKMIYANGSTYEVPILFTCSIRHLNANIEKFIIADAQ